MSQNRCSDVIVYVCCNCLPQGRHLPRQWDEAGARVQVCEIPCSGKMDAQYLLHAFEGGARGVCVVACRQGDCHLAQGNYRAEIRIRTVRRMLGEIGLEPERAEILHFGPDASIEELQKMVREAVVRVGACGATPLTAKQ